MAFAEASESAEASGKASVGTPASNELPVETLLFAELRGGELGASELGASKLGSDNAGSSEPKDGRVGAEGGSEAAGSPAGVGTFEFGSDEPSSDGTEGDGTEGEDLADDRFVADGSAGVALGNCDAEESRVRLSSLCSVIFKDGFAGDASLEFDSWLPFDSLPEPEVSGEDF